MTPRPLRHALLEAEGVEHGFGVRGAPEPPGVRRPRQVHGAEVASAAQCETAPPAQADAVLSLEPGVAVGVVTADCLPILAASADGRAVAAIHAGWRGLAQGVIEAAIGELAAAADTLAGSDEPPMHPLRPRERAARPKAEGVDELEERAQRAEGERSRILAAIGPHVGPCCYEVDEPVLCALAPRYGDALDAALRPSRSSHAWLDLGRLAREALRAAGVAADGIGELAGACTACDRERFHSYRRDGPGTGRLLHFIRAAR